MGLGLLSKLNKPLSALKQDKKNKKNAVGVLEKR